MARYIHKQCASAKWLDPTELSDTSTLGVGIRLPDGSFSYEPSTLNPTVTAAIQALNPAVAVTMASEITAAVFRQLSPYQSELQVQPRGIRIPIVESLDSMQDSINNIKNTFVCIVRREKIVLVWMSAVESILSHGTDIEAKLLASV
jgi:hypothetical protein